MVKFCNISLICELSLIGPKRKNVVFRPQDNNKMLLVKYEILDIYREIYISGFASYEIICSRFPTPPPIRHIKDYFEVSFFKFILNLRSTKCKNPSQYLNFHMAFLSLCASQSRKILDQTDTKSNLTPN